MTQKDSAEIELSKRENYCHGKPLFLSTFLIVASHILLLFLMKLLLFLNDETNITANIT